MLEKDLNITLKNIQFMHHVMQQLFGHKLTVENTENLQNDFIYKSIYIKWYSILETLNTNKSIPEIEYYTKFLSLEKLFIIYTKGYMSLHFIPDSTNIVKGISMIETDFVTRTLYTGDITGITVEDIVRENLNCPKQPTTKIKFGDIKVEFTKPVESPRAKSFRESKEEQQAKEDEKESKRPKNPFGYHPEQSEKIRIHINTRYLKYAGIALAVIGAICIISVLAAKRNNKAVSNITNKLQSTTKSGLSL